MSFGEFNKPSNSLMSEINTTPLVDVMLVLLIIFIITAPLITNNVNVNLPSSKSSASPQVPNVINIALDDKGQLFWNGKKITDQDLPRLLAKTPKNKTETQLLLQADRNTRYEKITQIMTEANKAGINKLGFSTKVD